MSLASIGWAVFWWFFPWPTARQAAALFALADIGIAIATALHADPLAALSTTPLFAMPGAFIVFFFGPRANAAHMAFATVTIVAAATWLALSDRPDAVALAIAKALIALTVTVGIFPFVQFGFWLIRSNSIESLTDPLTEFANRRGLANYLARKLNTLTSSLNRCASSLLIWMASRTSTTSTATRSATPSSPGPPSRSALRLVPRHSSRAPAERSSSSSTC